MSTTTLASPAVSAFAAAVRSALSDLPADEVDDLTDGLEADLGERLAEYDAAHDGGGGVEELGDPVAYAEELRTAAGLPTRAPTRRGIAAEFAELRHAPSILRRDIRGLIARTPALGRGAAFLVSLRPAWWVFRALAISALFAIWVGGAPFNGFTAVFGVAALIVSVQFGRGRWLPFAWMRALLLTLNIALAIATPFVIFGWATQLNNATYTESYAESIDPSGSGDGLTSNGNEVSNIFAYDAQGDPLTDVQLFDQDGHPLNVSGDPSSTTYYDQNGDVIVPNFGVTGRLGWNVFPLAQVSTDDVTDDGTLKDDVSPTAATAPFRIVKPIAEDRVGPTPSPIASGAARGPAPDASTAVPTPTPTPTPAP